jgi:hypothetical protein
MHGWFLVKSFECFWNKPILQQHWEPDANLDGGRLSTYIQQLISRHFSPLIDRTLQFEYLSYSIYECFEYMLQLSTWVQPTFSMN